MEEQTNNITTKLQQTQKNQQQSQRGFKNYRSQNYRGNRGNFGGRSRGNNRCYRNSRQPCHNNYGRTFNNQNSKENVQQQWTNLGTNSAENIITHYYTTYNRSFHPRSELHAENSAIYQNLL